MKSLISSMGNGHIKKLRFSKDMILSHSQPYHINKKPFKPMTISGKCLLESDYEYK